MTVTAIIYTRDNCSFCTKAKQLLRAKEIDYQERILDTNGIDDRILFENQSWVTKQDLLDLCPDAKTLPQIWVDNEYVGGYNALRDRFTKINLGSKL